FFFFSSRRRHTRSYGDWSSDVCSSDLHAGARQHAEADEAVDTGVISVRDEGRTVQSTTGTQTHLGGDFVADEADDPGGSQEPQKIGRASCRERVESGVGGEA